MLPDCPDWSRVCLHWQCGGSFDRNGKVDRSSLSKSFWFYGKLGPRIFKQNFSWAGSIWKSTFQSELSFYNFCQSVLQDLSWDRLVPPPHRCFPLWNIEMLYVCTFDGMIISLILHGSSIILLNGGRVDLYLENAHREVCCVQIIFHILGQVKVRPEKTKF